jgi:hypothetical protein
MKVELKKMADIEVFKVILDHESIKYQLAHGPNGIVFLIDKADKKKVSKHIVEWFDAVQNCRIKIEEANLLDKAANPV